MRTSSVDMTVGSEGMHIIRFALPLLAGTLLQQLYNIADTVIVGKALGDGALAAVGTTGSVNFLFYTFCYGLGTGAGIIAAQFFGAGLIGRMRAAVWNSVLVTALLGVIISIIGIQTAEPVMRLLHTPEELLPISVSYMRIAVGGTVAVAVYNWINAIIRALGDSRTPLFFLGVASALNIALDLLFVMGLGLGAAGAAAATVLAQTLSAAGCIVYAFLTVPELRFEAGDRRIDIHMIRLCVRTGIPIAMQSGLIALSMVALQRVTNGFGERVMAAYTASMRVEQLIHQPFAALNAARATFAGQNIGAGQQLRAQRGLRTGLQISSGLALLLCAVFWLFGAPIIRCFISGAESVAMGYYALRLTSLCYIPLGMIYVIRGFLNGAGDTLYALMNGLAEVICRIGGVLLMTGLFGIDWHAIWYTTCLTWIVTGTVGLLRYRGGVWRKKAFTGQEGAV